MGVLEGKVAIITGGGRGIGAAIAELYASEGASVVINDLGSTPDGQGGDTGPAQETADAIIAAGGAAVADGGDIADVATGERLVKLALDNFGKLDAVVNVAGILRDRMIFNLEEKDWDAVIRVHLKGHYSTIRPASAYWREQRNPEGHYRIINFTSGSALHGSPGQPNYAAAKLGVVGFTMSLATGLARYGVTANAISPGAATRLTATVPDDKVLDVVSSVSEDERSPHNVAPLAVFLASDRSDWLTGRVVSASGYKVGLYNVPEQVAEVQNSRTWAPDELASAMEKEFRPLADGLANSIFTQQLSS